MIGGWDDGNRLRAIMITLAVVGVAYLIFGTRSGPPQLSTWRGGGAPGIVGQAEMQQGGFNPDLVADQAIPTGNPLRNPRAVMTQGYGVGSHAPAEVWGGVDLAMDGDGDGQADPQGTWDAPVYATHGGTAEVHLDSWPGGNCVLLRAGGFRTTYCHLNSVSVADGAVVQRGQVIGAVGSSGNSSGPHLHYEVWVNEVNRNPLDFGALDGALR
jgi:murein DD-endopeptidase MepM/ murein hydrolase activator NlpD